MKSTNDPPACPRCAQRGHAVQPETLTALVRPAIRKTLQSPAGWAFCDTPECPVVYFPCSQGAGLDQGRTLEQADLSVPVGVKRSSAPRPLCYCFDHSVESLELELEPERALDQIKALMKTDGCRCVTTNPQGRCCLATVRNAIKAIQTEAHQ